MKPRATPWSPTRRRWTFKVTPYRVGLLVILGVTVVLLGFRFVVGLGEPTNLSDKWPWALWTWWKLTGVCLAGAGYSTAFMVHLMGRERWHDIERGAFVVSLLGYLMVCSALLIDLGQWYNAYRPVFNWGYHSVMFELFWCIGSYTVVQMVEFLYIFEERVPLKALRKVLNKIYVPLLLLGCFLPVFHQSAIVSLYVIAKGRLDPLWWSQLLPLYAVMTSFFIGPAVVTLENFIANRVYGRPVHMRILGDMVRLSSFLMFLFFIVRIADYAVRGVLPELLSGSLYGTIALLELGIGVVLPMVMFASPETRRSRSGMVTASALAVGGVALYRFNVTITGMVTSIGVGWYKPHWMEVVIVFGLAAAVMLAYMFIVENFPVYTPNDVAASEAAVAEAQARAKITKARPKFGILPIEEVRRLQEAPPLEEVRPLEPAGREP